MLATERSVHGREADERAHATEAQARVQLKAAGSVEMSVALA